MYTVKVYSTIIKTRRFVCFFFIVLLGLRRALTKGPGYFTNPVIGGYYGESIMYPCRVSGVQIIFEFLLVIIGHVPYGGGTSTVFIAFFNLFKLYMQLVSIS